MANNIDEALLQVKNRILAEKQKASESNNADTVAQKDIELKAIQGIANAYGIPFIGEGNHKPIDNDEAMLKAMQIIQANKDLYNKANNVVANTNNEVAKQQGEQWKTNAHKQAELMREVMHNMGANSQAFGNDTTNDQLMIALQNANENIGKKAKDKISKMSTKDLLKEPKLEVNPNEFYSRSYKELRAKGYPEFIARQRASSDAEEYQARYESEGLNAATTLGINDDGSLNDKGIDILARLANAGAVAPTQVINGSYATPLRQWGFNRDLDKANVNMAHNMEMLQNKLANSMKLANYKGQLASALSNQKAQEKAKLMQLAAALKPRVVYAGGGAGGRSGGTSSSEGKVSKPPSWLDEAKELYQAAKDSIGTDEAATNIGNLYEFAYDKRNKYADDPEKKAFIKELLRQSYALTYKNAVETGVRNGEAEGRKNGQIGSSYAEEAYNALSAINDEYVERDLGMTPSEKAAELEKLKKMMKS